MLTTFYHVYCETENEETITPSYDDALRTFKKYCRDYPSEVVDFDSIFGDNTMSDIADGIYNGTPHRIMQSQPEMQK